MRYEIYSELLRQLSELERYTVFEAVDALIPDSGCVGRMGMPNDEVYFCVFAESEDDARSQAITWMTAVLRQSKLELGFGIQIHASSQLAPEHNG